MMLKTVGVYVWGAVLLCLAAATQAAILVSSDSDGEVSDQYFGDGQFVLMAGGQPTFGVDRQGNCWFLERGQLVSDPCERMLESVSAMRDQAMAGLGADERKMMEQMMGMGRPAAAIDITPVAGRTVAGYPADCHRIGDAREVCVSGRLLDEVRAEVGNVRFIELFEQLGNASGMPGTADAETRALVDLLGRGFPVWDMRREAALPGMNAAMLQYLPEAQRAQIMQQLGAAGGAPVERGTRVIRIERGVAMPKLDLSRYPRMGFDDYLRQSLGAAGGMPRGR